MNNDLKKILDWIFGKLRVYFYLIDNNNEKIIVFVWTNILEISLINRWGYYLKSDSFYFYLRELNDLDTIYTFVNWKKSITGDIDLVIKSFLKYEKSIKDIFIKENIHFYNEVFDKTYTDKKILLIIKWGWLQETIESAFIAYCYNSNLQLTILYRFWTQWWKKLNYSWFFNELKSKYRNFRFIYNEDINDDYIDSLIDSDTEVFSLWYDYVWKHKNIHLIVSASVSEDWVYWKYKNIFSCFKSESIWYSKNKFLNTENTNIYHFFNPQNTVLLNSFSLLGKINNFVLWWWMSWSRDFSILNSLNWEYRWVLISDKHHDINNFLSIEQIRSYYWFLWAINLSTFFVHTPIWKYNNDDRHKMIATSICAGKPVVVPNSEWLIVKEILDNRLWVVYENWNKEDFLEKVEFFAKNSKNIEIYSQNCKKYSIENMDINKYVNFIFSKAF